LNITYNGNGHFRLEQEIVFPNHNPNILSVRLIARDGINISIEFETNFSDDAQAISTTQRIVNKIEKVIFFQWSKEIRDLHLYKVQHTNDDSKILKIYDRMDLHSQITIVNKYNQNDIADLVELYDKQEEESALYNLFIDISKMKDKIGSYIMLYSLLLIVIDSKQKELDKYIVSEFPDVEMRPTTRQDKEYSETIFTYLRNQLGHLPETSDTNKINSEILKYYDSFVVLVKNALIQKGLVY